MSDTVGQAAGAIHFAFEKSSCTYVWRYWPTLYLMWVIPYKQRHRSDLVIIYIVTSLVSPQLGNGIPGIGPHQYYFTIYAAGV